MADAQGKSIVELTKGIGEIDIEDEHPESGEIIAREDVPSSALKEYADEGRSMYPDLLKDLVQEFSKEKSKLSMFKRGETTPPPGAYGDADAWRTRSARGLEKFWFRNSTVKAREVNRQQMRVRDLESLRSSLSQTSDNDSLYALLKDYGPHLDPRRANKIGFLSDAYALHPYNDHDVAVAYEDAPYLLWVPSTAGLSIGQDVLPSPVYVAGTATAEFPGRGSIAVTVLITLTDAELKKAVYGDDNSTAKSDSPANSSTDSSSNDGFRTWTDVTGMFTVEAQMIDSDANQIVLKTRDGKIVPVPRSKLSEQDLEFLKNNK